MRYQPLAQIRISMFGKIWKLSMAHFLTLPGLVPLGVTMRCGPSSGVIIGPRNSGRVCSGFVFARLTKTNPAHTSQCTGSRP
ncbi:hypothetical protein ABT150_05295 [Streptomyces mirabilis]|uniref:hypothetical protein n=1 Tax=Streptomyces mirabilis TaxID=68239 RepID=UPI0033319CC6